MKPADLDDLTPPEPGDDELARVRTQSQRFRRRRNTQRRASVAAGALVVVLVGGIALARNDNGNRHVTTVPPVQSDELEGTWVPVAFTDYEGPLASPPLGWVPRLTFATDGKWSGSDGCNDVSGVYRLDDDGGFRFEFRGSTAVGCPPDTPPFDQLYATARVGLQPSQLTFFAADGHEIARYEREKITTRLELPSTTMTASSAMSARVVVENDSGAALQASGCGLIFRVVLANDAIDNSMGWTCEQQFTIPVGESNYPVTVVARYVGCNDTDPTTYDPACGTGNGQGPGPLPLPPGEYRATVEQMGNAVPTPAPITVQVVPQPPRTTSTTTTTTTPPAPTTSTTTTTTTPVATTACTHLPTAKAANSYTGLPAPDAPSIDARALPTNDAYGDTVKTVGLAVEKSNAAGSVTLTLGDNATVRLHGVGDFDGDGRGDLLVEAIVGSDYTTYIVPGTVAPGTYAPATVGVRIPNPHDKPGDLISMPESVGDQNGDGADDVSFGSELYSGRALAALPAGGAIPAPFRTLPATYVGLLQIDADDPPSFVVPEAGNTSLRVLDRHSDRLLPGGDGTQLAAAFSWYAQATGWLDHGRHIAQFSYGTRSGTTAWRWNLDAPCGT